MTAVLFVDIVDATPLAVSLGDHTSAELLEHYHELAVQPSRTTEVG